MEEAKKIIYHVVMVASSDIKNNVGLNLKILRKSKNLTQEQLGEQVGLDSQSIKAIETGRAFVSAESLSKFSNFFNVEPEYFLKSKPFNISVENSEVKKEINRLLSGFNSEDLQRIYKIIAALKN